MPPSVVSRVSARARQGRCTRRAGTGSRGRVANAAWRRRDSAGTTGRDRARRACAYRRAGGRGGAARRRTGVRAGCGRAGATSDTPFRIASISKSFTASLASLVLDLDEPLDGGATPSCFFAHRGSAPARGSSCPGGAAGSGRTRTRGTVRAGRACEAAARTSSRTRCASGCSSRSGSRRTGFEEPADAAPGHVQDGETGHRASPEVVYPESRRPPAGSGRRSATCSASPRTTSAVQARCPARGARCASRGPRRSAAATASAGGAAAGRRSPRVRSRGLGRRVPVAAPARSGRRSWRSRC